MILYNYFFFNGQEYYTKQQVPISALIIYFNYNTSFFVLEYNNLICNKKNWQSTFVKNQDKIEIITIVGGG